MRFLASKTALGMTNNAYISVIPSAARNLRPPAFDRNGVFHYAGRSEFMKKMPLSSASGEDVILSEARFFSSEVEG